MRKFRILIGSIMVLGSVAIIALSCNKGSTTAVKPNTNVKGIKATVINTGDVAADGCGYLVQIDSATFYHPDNLPTAFQKDKLNVTVNYDLSDAKFQCGMNPDTHIPVIHIKDINNR
jgi:hypothetical protein